MTVPGLSVIRKTSSSLLSTWSSAKPSLGVMPRMRADPRSGHKRPDPDQPEMRRDDQPVDLLVGDIGERKHRPVARMLRRA
jgi:hypothetical protein